MGKIKELLIGYVEANGREPLTTDDLLEWRERSGYGLTDEQMGALDDAGGTDDV